MTRRRPDSVDISQIQWYMLSAVRTWPARVAVVSLSLGGPYRRPWNHCNIPLMLWVMGWDGFPAVGYGEYRSWSL